MYLTIYTNYYNIRKVPSHHRILPSILSLLRHGTDPGTGQWEGLSRTLSIKV